MSDYDDSTSVKGGRVPTFDGQASKFQVWWFKFMSHASTMKFKTCMKDIREKDLPTTEEEVIDESTEEGQRKKAARQRNETAMSAFATAFVGETMHFVFRACTDEYPDGLAHLVVKGLMGKYRPNDAFSLVEMRTRMNNIRMASGSDPELIFNQIYAIQTEFKGQDQGMTKVDIMSVIVGSAPAEYQDVLTSMHASKGSSVTVMDLENLMTNHYRQLQRLVRRDEGSVNTGDNGEIALSSVGFGGTCYICK